MLTTARIKDELIQEGTPHQSKEEKLSSSLPSMTLLHRLAQNEVPWRTRLLWLQQIAMALSHLHGQSQIHGSLTGDHIRILDNETVELVPASPMIRRTTGVLNYLAPEYFTTSTAQTKTAAMDVYGFAMIMFLICTGKEPWFRFFPNSQPQLIYAVASSKRPSLPKNSQPPEGYVALMKSCWEQDPSKRPAMKDVCAMIASLKEPEPKKMEEKPKQADPAKAKIPLMDPSEYYEVGKTFMRNQKWLDAFKYFQSYYNLLNEGAPTHRKPSEDFHLFYLAICFHNANYPAGTEKEELIRGPKNEWKDLLCEWMSKHHLNLDGRNPPAYIREALAERDRSMTNVETNSPKIMKK